MGKDIKKIVKEIIEKELFDTKFDSDKFYDMDFKTDIGLDSLQLVEIAMSCEHKFSIKIEDESILEMRTPNDLINYIKKVTNE